MQPRHALCMLSRTEPILCCRMAMRIWHCSVAASAVAANEGAAPIRQTNHYQNVATCRCRQQKCLSTLRRTQNGIA
jgi:hypothetical protein